MGRILELFWFKSRCRPLLIWGTFKTSGPVSGGYNHIIGLYQDNKCSTPPNLKLILSTWCISWPINHSSKPLSRITHTCSQENPLSSWDQNLSNVPSLQQDTSSHSFWPQNSPLKSRLISDPAFWRYICFWFGRAICSKSFWSGSRLRRSMPGQRWQKLEELTFQNDNIRPC